MKKLMIGVGLTALLALPALAADQGAPRPEPKPMTRAEVQTKLAERFAKLDLNKDSAITKAEVDQAREAMKARRTEQRAKHRDERFQRLDTNKDGQLSKAEYDAGFAARGQRDGKAGPGGRHHRGMHRGMMHRGQGDFLARLDANKDGKVTLPEFEAKPLAMFDRADANKDGTVTPAERQAARQAMRAEWQAKRAR